MSIALGIGCDRGTPVDTLRRAVAQALAQVQADWPDVAAVGSITLKADEPALQALAAEQGWTITYYTPAQLAAVPVPNPSETVRRHTGTPSVSEAAALLGAGAGTEAVAGAAATALLLEKHKLKGGDGRNATVSVARCDVRHRRQPP
ncbi:cobalamin biosynthesis protein [Hydrogenophaga sp.]|uniref:cobalamin biosynthesis protein n=1 Tax=Hydrogenophaga sp. TaxID=1904254 RepID=UPI00286E5A93|nr:cobalamin biosynthesis protein [Hydrogenophaga sp.]